MYFYIGDSGGIVKSPVIRKLEDHDDGGQGKDYGVVCGLAEFKLQTGSLKMHCSQIFADTIRIGSLLAVNALARGKLLIK